MVERARIAHREAAEGEPARLRASHFPVAGAVFLLLLAVALVAFCSAEPTERSGLMLLPSGLPLISIAAAGRTAIAIDAMGALFASHDQGQTWERIAHRWRGRATKVRLAQPLGVVATPFHSGGSAKKSKVRAGAALAVFELIDDGDAVWASADGEDWSPE